MQQRAREQTELSVNFTQENRKIKGKVCHKKSVITFVITYYDITSYYRLFCTCSITVFAGTT